MIKVSDDDLAWLFPEVYIDDVAKRWIIDGVFLVVITRGANGIWSSLANSFSARENSDTSSSMKTT